MRRTTDSYFHFTKRERTGIITIMVLVSLLIAISYFYRSARSGKLVTAEYNDELERLKIIRAESIAVRKSYRKPYNTGWPNNSLAASITGKLFYFDPNRISEEEWKSLGLREKTISIIQNYLSKGGKFRKPEDLRNIWGLEEKLAERLIPYVRIISEKESEGSFKKTYADRKEAIRIDINLADSASFEKLPGIGQKLSQRIIRYRERLGGFNSADQVAETFGLPDSVFQKIKPSLQISGIPVKKININSSTVDEMKAHPYIRYHLANAIIQYRQQHGAYKRIEDLKHIMLMNDSVYNRISGYISIE